MIKINRKVIIISLLPLNKDIKEKLKLDELERMGIDYEYWSTYYLEYKSTTIFYDRIKSNRERIFYNKEEFLEAISELNKDNIVVKTAYFKKDLQKIYIELLKKRIKIIYFSCNNIPKSLNLIKELKEIKLIKRLYIPLKIDYEKFLNKINIKFLQKFLEKKKEKLIQKKVRYYEYLNRDNIYVLYSGKKSLTRKHRALKKLIPIMSSDYKNYLKFQDKNLEDQILFIDQNLPEHPDFKMTGEKSINKENYYIKLNNFFSLIENKYNTKVIIAAHPKSNYQFNQFNGRKIIKGETALELKKSRMIISSYSTAIGMATIENKKIFLIKTNDFTSEMNKNIEIFSKALELPIFNIDKIISEDSLNFEINIKKYKKYREDYLYYDEEDEKKSDFEVLKTIIF